MFKLIFKNLWNRRGRYAWLFIELIVVTGLAWYILDPAIVSLHDATLPLGYDSDRIVIIDVATLPRTDPRFDPDTARVPADDRNRMLTKIKFFGDVDLMTVQDIGNTMNDQSISIRDFRTGSPNDTLHKQVNVINFIPGQHFLETYGIRSVPGSPTVEELSARSYSLNEIIITEALANMCWPGENAVGKKTKRGDGTDDSLNEIVVGVVGDFRYQSFNRTNCALFNVWSNEISDDSFSIAVRLTDGVSPDDWIARFRPWAVHEMITGNYYVKSVTPHRNIIAETEYNTGVTATRRTAWLLAAFFLVNLVLGVLGSFYLQTRRRIGEAGIHRAFGARRSNIFGMLMGESVVLATAAFLVGDVLFMQYALRVGLDTGYSNNNIYNVIDTWVTHFGQHFALVSAVIYVVIIICVIIGTWIPAYRVSRTNVVNSLRDEG